MIPILKNEFSHTFKSFKSVAIVLFVTLTSIVNNEENIPLLIERLTAQRVKIYEVKIEVTSSEDVFMAV
ncbi:hypothetical protein [Exiguobacterium sp. s166]|uniref:hypothetical protein n=1 Tax=unclassified Exiguobacterium TaxID=2644629 RepID=UPI00104DB34B|nr:hypothetical protein [Exiguobacterium sp. s166]